MDKSTVSREVCSPVTYCARLPRAYLVGEYGIWQRPHDVGGVREVKLNSCIEFVLGDLADVSWGGHPQWVGASRGRLTIDITYNILWSIRDSVQFRAQQSLAATASNSIL